jgi:hypothetical protein
LRVFVLPDEFRKLLPSTDFDKSVNTTRLSNLLASFSRE